MRGTIVTIDTVHAPSFRRRALFRAEWPIAIVILRDVPVEILDANPWNHLSLVVARDEGDFIPKIHVPVNSGHNTTGRITTTDINQHPSLSQRVLFVVGVVIESLELCAMKLRRPMTLFAGLISRPHIVNRSFDWL